MNISGPAGSLEAGGPNSMFCDKTFASLESVLLVKTLLAQEALSPAGWQVIIFMVQTAQFRRESALATFGPGAGL
jgi:hypothetical protein